MRKLLLLTLLAAGLAACSDSADTGNKEVTAEPETEAVAPDWKESAFPEYFGELHTQDSSFSLDSFAATEQEPGTADAKGYPMEPERLVPFQSLFIYNGDSTKAIDLFSYNYIANTRNGQQVMTAGEPDTEVALLDYTTKTRKRLLFLGPSFAALDARWLSNNQVAIAGAELLDGQQVKPIIWKVTLPGGEVETEFYTDTVRADIPAIREQRFRSVKFQ